MGVDFAAVLAAHAANVGPLTGSWWCACGESSDNTPPVKGGPQPDERRAEYRTHLAFALDAAVREWLGSEEVRERVARAMSGPHWWAEDDNGVGDEIRQSIRDDAALGLAALTAGNR